MLIGRVSSSIDMISSLETESGTGTEEVFDFLDDRWSLETVFDDFWVPCVSEIFRLAFGGLEGGRALCERREIIIKRRRIKNKRMDK